MRINEQVKKYSLKVDFTGLGDRLIVLDEEEDFKDDFQISCTSNWADGRTIF